MFQIDKKGFVKFGIILLIIFPEFPQRRGAEQLPRNIPAGTLRHVVQHKIIKIVIPVHTAADTPEFQRYFCHFIGLGNLIKIADFRADADFQQPLSH